MWPWKTKVREEPREPTPLPPEKKEPPYRIYLSPAPLGGGMTFCRDPFKYSPPLNIEDVKWILPILDNIGTQKFDGVEYRAVGIMFEVTPQKKEE